MATTFALRLAATAATALIVAGCTTSSPRITTTYYNIAGVTGADLDREIAEKGPLRGHAMASAAIKFVPVRVTYDKSGGMCRFHDATFRIEANVTLPRWSGSHQSEPELKTAWKFLAKYAREHEGVHVSIAESYAKKIGEELKALPARKSCDQLDADAERVLKRIKTAHNRDQLAFDAAEQKRLDKLLQ